jgi:desulfoferrodoxin (superoxide reductase-like protein)
MDEWSRRDFVSRMGVAAFGIWLPGCMAHVGVDDGSGGEERNDAWETQAAALEGTKVYDKSTQWMGEDKAATHVPQVTVSEGTVLVLVPHPTTIDHYITAIYLRDQDGVIIAFVEYEQPTKDSDVTGVSPPPIALEGSVTSVTAYAHCNKHNTWKADPVGTA